MWQQKLFMHLPQVTIDGRPIEVVDVGRHNYDSGPDFFGAKIKIDGTYWVGNVEIHLRASDWYRHHHQTDAAYDSTILHVVATSDADICRTDGTPISQCVLNYPEDIYGQYEQWLQKHDTVACSDRIKLVPHVIISGWLTTLLLERLSEKADRIDRLLEQHVNSWEDAFYISVARNFGFHTNSQPFEQLARSLPLSCISKHRNSLIQIEALLFGQAGLLNDAVDDYSRQLQQEYRFLQQKFQLKPIDGSTWKMMRMRPQNLPHIRIAQFARLMHLSPNLFGQIIDNPSPQNIRRLFDICPDTYWDTHYHFGAATSAKPKPLGQQSVNVIIINTIAPYLFVYGKRHDNHDMEQAAISLLEDIPAERNAHISKCVGAGLEAHHAADTQALLQLYQNYCMPHRCLHCRIGHQVLAHHLQS